MFVRKQVPHPSFCEAKQPFSQISGMELSWMSTNVAGPTYSDLEPAIFSRRAKYALLWNKPWMIRTPPWIRSLLCWNNTGPTCTASTVTEQWFGVCNPNLLSRSLQCYWLGLMDLIRVSSHYPENRSWRTMQVCPYAWLTWFLDWHHTFVKTHLFVGLCDTPENQCESGRNTKDPVSKYTELGHSATQPMSTSWTNLHLTTVLAYWKSSPRQSRMCLATRLSFFCFMLCS